MRSFLLFITLHFNNSCQHQLHTSYDFILNYVFFKIVLWKVIRQFVFESLMKQQHSYEEYCEICGEIVNYSNKYIIYIKGILVVLTVIEEE